MTLSRSAQPYNVQAKHLLFVHGTHLVGNSLEKDVRQTHALLREASLDVFTVQPNEVKILNIF